MTYDRRRALRYGLRAEIFSVIFLMLKGWRIMSLRHRNFFGEVDIIALRKDLVIFVEVKARPNIKAAIDAVSVFSQKRIRATGEAWLAKQKNAHLLSYRCDIIAVIPWRLPEHLCNAF